MAADRRRMFVTKQD